MNCIYKENEGRVYLQIRAENKLMQFVVNIMRHLQKSHGASPYCLFAGRIVTWA